MNAQVQNTLITAQISQLSVVLGLHNVDPAELEQTLIQTAFKSTTQITREQMGALLIVASQYKLNPWTKEIYAFPDKSKGNFGVRKYDFIHKSRNRIALRNIFFKEL